MKARRHLAATFRVRSIGEADRPQVARILLQRWGAPGIVSRGTIHRAQDYPGFLALSGGRIVGLLTYRIERGRCEVVSLDALRRLKPSIPKVGMHGIPLRDEIELYRRFRPRKAGA